MGNINLLDKWIGRVQAEQIQPATANIQPLSIVQTQDLQLIRDAASQQLAAQAFQASSPP